MIANQVTGSSRLLMMGRHSEHSVGLIFIEDIGPIYYREHFFATIFIVLSSCLYAIRA